jgi:hypothetical protein
VPDLTPDAMAWLAGHHGVITTPALRSCGTSRSTTDRLVRAGVLVNPHKSAYVLTASPPTMEQRCALISAAHPGGFVTGPTAGVLLNLRRMPHASALHYAVRHGIHLGPEPGVRFRQTTALLPAHRQVRADGIAIAIPPRLAFDLGPDLSLLDHLSVVHQLLNTELVALEALVEIGRRLCHPARRGSTRFKKVLERIGSGAPAHSHPEIVLEQALLHRHVPIERQSMAVQAGGRLVRIDLAVPAVKWGIELDIHPEHRSVEGHGSDARRYRGLHLVEWQIEPVSEIDMLDIESIADELTALYHGRRRHFSACRSAS